MSCGYQEGTGEKGLTSDSRMGAKTDSGEDLASLASFLFGPEDTPAGALGPISTAPELGKKRYRPEISKTTAIDTGQTVSKP